MTYGKKTYRIKSKFRFTTAVTLALILICFMANTILGLDNASSLTKEKAPLEIQIQYGDSLWNIASEFGPADKDIRETVYEICALNDISADSIYPGQIILVPDYGLDY
ncbi:MAG: LysM peptidoglycan-binding domain-containing protein [Anaerovoracaceae bacterium]